MREAGMRRVNGKVAIVTGAARGLGRADAEALAREGATVVLTDLSADAGARTTAEIARRQPGRAIFLQQDVRDEEGWRQVIEATLARFGRLDVLVNNAGVAKAGDPETTTLEDFRFHAAVMSEGVFLGCKHAIGAMKRSGGGSIVNVSSTSALVGYPGVIAYTAAKGAVRAMTRSVAVHCQRQGYGIRCNSILPGPIDTPLLSGVRGDGPGDQSRATAASGRPEDVANLVLFLASDESRHINGAELVIDDAYTAR